MNNCEFKQLIKQSMEIGFTKVSDLQWLAKTKGYYNKNDLINGVNELFVKGFKFDPITKSLSCIG